MEPKDTAAPKSTYILAYTKVLHLRNSALQMDSKKSANSSVERRNLQSSFQWYGQSSSRPSQVRGSRARYSVHEASSSQLEKPLSRPKSAHYIYDGGFFNNPSSPKHDYFVIHPDWVSEEKSIQKLSQKDWKARSSTWPGRRARSAPPSYRNPITWES